MLLNRSGRAGLQYLDGLTKRPLRGKTLGDLRDEDCTVVFDADNAYCADQDASMSRADALNCVATGECEIPEKFKPLLERIVQKPRHPGPPTVTVVDSEGEWEMDSSSW